MNMEFQDFTEATTAYWQEILPPCDASPSPLKFSYPSRLPDQRILALPIRPLVKSEPGHNDAVASLLVNQASISVVAELGAFLRDKVRHFEPEVIIGLPTLGLTLAPIVAQGLGLRTLSLRYLLLAW